LTSFIIEHQCPQCGAPAELEETDRLFQCDYCRVKSYLDATGTFRYALPHHAPAGKKLIYFPYWRFNGMLFFCVVGEIKNRFVDFSRQAIATAHFPFSLGFRSQTQKLHFAVKASQGLFLSPDIDKADFIEDIYERFSGHIRKPILHQAQIGETISLVYAPYYAETKLMDAILNKPAGSATAEALAPLLTTGREPHWPLRFLSTLCPQCGWDLNGEKDVLALACDNCHTVWWPKGGKLEQLDAAHLPAPADDPVYMPFWRIQADISGVALNSYADLIRVANLPKVAQAGDAERNFYFWCPAFKVRPQAFLTYAAQATTCQVSERLSRGRPKARLQGVNLSLQEAAESLVLILTTLVRPRQRMEELLPVVKVNARRFLLVYLPFWEGPHEFINPGMNLAINKNLLKHAKNL
jgi:hypothetical protein